MRPASRSCSRAFSRLLISGIGFLFAFASADVKLGIIPRGATLKSGKNATKDTVVVETYVYNGGDSTYVNKGKTSLLYVDVRIDTASAAKHYLAPGDSLEAFTGFMLKDTVAVPKTAFALIAWTDPLKSFGPVPAIEDLRVASLYVDLHPKLDTVYLAGCPVATEAHPAPSLPGVAGMVPTTVYNVAGRPVWSGMSRAGAQPAIELPEGAYLLSQGTYARIFRVLPR